MPKAKRSRRETMSQEDAQKLKLIKKRLKEWKAWQTQWQKWADEYKQASPEQQELMLRESRQAHINQQQGIVQEKQLSQMEQIILDLKLRAFQETENDPQTREEQKFQNSLK